MTVHALVAGAAVSAANLYILIPQVERVAFELWVGHFEVKE
jgi:hypothetical protein